MAGGSYVLGVPRIFLDLLKQKIASFILLVGWCSRCLWDGLSEQKPYLAILCDLFGMVK